MDGYIISYEKHLSSKEITNINYALFGKVLTKKGKKYYYPGLFDNILYTRLGNGCYIVCTSNKDIIQQLKSSDKFKTIKASVDSTLLSLDTARNTKKNNYKDTYVKNL